MAAMTGRERIMTALRGGTPDRVPATPDENIRELVAVAESFGTYPLDLDRIQGEVERLEA